MGIMGGLGIMGVKGEMGIMGGLEIMSVMVGDGNYERYGRRLELW